MKILLVTPSQYSAYGARVRPPYPSLGLLYIGTVLKEAGHDVKLIDMDAQRLDTGSFSEILDTYGPALVGITGTSPSHGSILSLADRVKKIIPGTRVILGGPHATAVAGEMMENENVDFIVAGEGEKAVLQLVTFLEGNGEIPDIPGLYKKVKGRIVEPSIPFAEPPNPEDLPIPDRSLVPPDAKYSPPDAHRFPVAHILASRGCPWNCGFCASRMIFGRKERFRSPESVITEINRLADDGVREVHFADDSLTESREWLLTLCDGLNRYGKIDSFMFMNGLRADRLDREMLEALKSIGVKNLEFGIESGDAEIRKTMGKRLDMDAVERNIAMASEMGFEIWLFFLIGYIGETDETMQRTLDLAIRLKPDFAKFMIVKPFPGTPFRERLSEMGLLVDRDYGKLGIYTPPVHTLPGMSRKRMMWWLRKANRRFYIRPWFLARTVFSRFGNPARFRANLSAFGFVLRLMMRKQ